MRTILFAAETSITVLVGSTFMDSMPRHSCKAALRRPRCHISLSCGRVSFELHSSFGSRFLDALVCRFTDPPPLKVSTRGRQENDPLGGSRPALSSSADERWELPHVGVGLSSSSRNAPFYPNEPPDRLGSLSPPVRSRRARWRVQRRRQEGLDEEHEVLRRRRSAPLPAGIISRNAAGTTRQTLEGPSRSWWSAQSHSHSRAW